MPGFLDGTTTPASPAERVELAGFCALKRLNRAAARFYDQAFAAEPKLAEDAKVRHRYHAARAAALAGCGQGDDADKLDQAEKAQWRGRALEWLRADLKAWAGLLDAEPARSAANVSNVLRRWLVETDFAGGRGREALAKLPEAERPAWQKLWNDVADALKRAQGMGDPGKEVRRPVAPLRRRFFRHRFFQTILGTLSAGRRTVSCQASQTVPEKGATHASFYLVTQVHDRPV